MCIAAGMRVFRRDDITADVVMASAALPHVFRAVEIEGEPYWDGGFTGNPAILPLVASNGRRCAAGADRAAAA